MTGPGGWAGQPIQVPWPFWLKVLIALLAGTWLRTLADPSCRRHHKIRALGHLFIGKSFGPMSHLAEISPNPSTLNPKPNFNSPTKAPFRGVEFGVSLGRQARTCSFFQILVNKPQTP